VVRWAATYYDAVHLAAKAINEAKSLDSDRIRAAFATIKHAGLLANYGCDPKGNCNNQILIVEIKQGQPGIRSVVEF
jgi:branched-chain amino acid transport system substrate-binding protein